MSTQDNHFSDLFAIFNQRDHFGFIIVVPGTKSSNLCFYELVHSRFKRAHGRILTLVLVEYLDLYLFVEITVAKVVQTHGSRFPLWIEVALDCLRGIDRLPRLRCPDAMGTDREKRVALPEPTTHTCQLHSLQRQVELQIGLDFLLSLDLIVSFLL